MAEKQFVKEIADMTVDFPQWYTDVVLKTGLVDYGPVKGTMVMRPYGYGIWENIQRNLDQRIKATGHSNVYFPILIPESLLKKEAEHVEGFAPEVAMVTRAGNEDLAEPLVIRPTSETIFCTMYSKWIQSYRDLPIMYNQWANVIRWEKTTRPFLRTSEFLWQEGHTAHATREESLKETLDMLDVYATFAKEVLALPTFTGLKSDKEKFAGADATYGMEAMMLDGKSLQAGTTHHFGQKFSKAYDIQFLDKDGSHKYVWQSSWGVSTRLIGALIMAHGDQRGLVLPPMVAPIQAVVIPVAMHKEGVVDKVKSVVASLVKAGIRATGDYSDQSPGWKFNEYEMKGVPVRLEIGPRDIENGVATVVRRDNHDKFTLPLEDIDKQLAQLLTTIQCDMYNKALAFRDSHVQMAHNMSELESILNKGFFAKVVWDKSAQCEALVKERLQATVRVMLDEPLFQDKCTVCGGKGDLTVAIIARAY